MISDRQKGHFLKIQGIKEEEIAYNPAVIVQKNLNKISGGVNIIAARVENLNSNWLDQKFYNPHIMFFTLQNNSLTPITETPIFRQYEDPWATWLVGKDNELKLLFGGVKIDNSKEEPVITTQIHLSSSVQELNPDIPFAEIRGMKDVRFAQLPNRQIAVFTRPITGDAYPGRIGLTIINDIEEIRNPETIRNIKLLKFNLNYFCKIGTNEAFFIKETGLLHVFGHIAFVDGDNFDDGSKPIHYVGCEFEVDPKSPFDNIITPKITVKRSDFPENTKKSKGSRFNDVVFPGGTGGPEETLYFAGVEDALIGVINLK